MTKILIVVEGGIVQSVFSTEKLEIVVADYDQGMDNLEVLGEDLIFKSGLAYELIEPLVGEKLDEDESKLKQFLKENKF